ncbi:site-specific integrase, partial [Nocardia gipuzkoensis]
MKAVDAAGAHSDSASAALQRQIAAYLDHLTVERGVARNTLSAYRRDLGRYQEFLARRGAAGLDAVSESDIADFVVALRAGSGGYPALA